MSKIFKIIVELYELLITARKDDRMGRVVFTGSLKVDDLIDVAVTRGSELNAATLKAAYERLMEIALDEIRNGKLVEFGFTHNGVAVNGVFIGDHARWIDGEHKLYLKAIPTVEVRKALKEVTVEVRGMAASGTYINSLTDVVSGEINTRLTPGGGVNLSGVKIKLVGDSPDVGISLINVEHGDVIRVPSTSILVNDPSKITFIVPPSLSAGDYRLSLATQYAVGALLKEPRTCVFDNVLACG